jgi:hypothetical protein
MTGAENVSNYEEGKEPEVEVEEVVAAAVAVVVGGEMLDSMLMS